MAQKCSTGPLLPVLTTTRSILTEVPLLGALTLRRHTRPSRVSRWLRVLRPVCFRPEPRVWSDRTSHQCITKEESAECSSPKHRYVCRRVPTSGCMTSSRHDDPYHCLPMCTVWMTLSLTPFAINPFPYLTRCLRSTHSLFWASIWLKSVHWVATHRRWRLESHLKTL